MVFGESDANLQLPLDKPMRVAFPALLKAFLSESKGKSEGQFLRMFTETIQQTANTPDVFSRWHEIISILRKFAVSQLTDANSRLRVENLVQQAWVVIGEFARRHFAYENLLTDQKLHILGEISQG